MQLVFVCRKFDILAFFFGNLLVKYDCMCSYMYDVAVVVGVCLWKIKIYYLRFMLLNTYVIGCDLLLG